MFRHILCKQQDIKRYKNTGQELGKFILLSLRHALSYHLPPSNDRQARLISDSKLPLGVIVSVWLFVFMCQPCSDQATGPGCTPSLAQCQLRLAPASP